MRITARPIATLTVLRGGMSLLCLATTACSPTSEPADASVLDGGAQTKHCMSPDAGLPNCVRFNDLIREMGTLDHLARRIDPSFETHQASSYDRRSTDPLNTSPDDGWFANVDRGNFEREVTVQGRRELVMAEAAGAGAITRIWSAGPLGTIRIYIDDFEVPAIETSMETLLTGNHPLFPSPFAYVAARGHNLYFPIPFGRRVRVTTDELVRWQELYYIVNYRLYAPGVDVEAFSTTLHSASAQAIADATAVLTDPELLGSTAISTVLPTHRTGNPNAPIPFTVNSPTSSGGVIRRLTIQSNGSEAALRGAVLSLSFDGHETVRTPVGDFFGTGPGAHDLETIALSATDGGTFVSRFPMPFMESATIAIEGVLDAEVTVTVDDWDFSEDSFYFHAGWGGPGVVESQPKRDLSVVRLTGAGNYVGTHLLVVNPINEWWGEGDEKIYVDGDTFPTWFGTGTEDYFGYAHIDLNLFSRPYHAQSRTGGRTQTGHISNLRIHGIDPIVYQTSLDFDLELWAWVGSELAVNWVSYWYTGTGSDNFAALRAGTERVVSPATLRR